MKKLKTILFISFLMGFTVNGMAQCKRFTKNKCLNEMEPYMSNGQLNAAMMLSGEQAEVGLNFNKALSYRLIVCADSYFEGLKYQLVDESGTVFLKDSIAKGSNSSVKDIKVENSGPLQLQLQTPLRESTTGIKRNGCVSILIGFKE